MDKTIVQQKISIWAKTDPEAAHLIGDLLSAFPAAHQIFFVGGALRDVLLGISPSKDIDIVVDAPSLEWLAQRLPATRQNFFGGLSFAIDKCLVDIWPLRETFHIKEFSLAPTIEMFLAGAPFNLDKIAFNVRTDELFEEGCLEGLESQKIAYQPLNPYLEHIQTARCILLQKKIGFALRSSTQALLSRTKKLFQSDDRYIAEVRDYLHRAYGMEDAKDQEEVVEAINNADLPD